MAKPDAERTLREMIQVLRDENQSLERQIRVAEALHLRFMTRVYASEEAMLSAMLAVRILAKAVSPKTAEGRKVRAEARAVLEQRRIRPPGTLGSSRTKKSRRRRRLDGSTAA